MSKSSLKQIVDVVPIQERNKWNQVWDFVDSNVFTSSMYTIQVPIRSDRVMPLILNCEQAQSSDQVSQDILSQINSIDILGVINVDGYCQIIERKLCTFVLARDIAIGGGLCRYEEKSSHTGVRNYESILWSRFTEYFNETVAEIIAINRDLAQFIQPLDQNGYILLEVALGILNRCNNATAKKFRAELLFNIVPKIQNDTIAKFMENLNQLGSSIDQQNKEIEYYKHWTNTNELFRSTEIAKDFGLSAKTLHILLNYLGIIFRVNGRWVVYQPYAHFGYILSKEGNNTDTYWTHAGRAFVINTLIGYGLQLGKDNRQIVENILDYT